jgi:type IV pilus assembly protein PilV
MMISAREYRPQRQAGFTMMEVLVTLVVLLLGLLGLVSLQVRAHQAEMESYQRAQALVLMQDMIDRLNSNRKAASCYAVTTASGAPYLGVADSGHSGAISCTATGTSADAMAVSSVNAWDTALTGASEKDSGGNAIGVMLGARGCIGRDAGANSTFTYTVAVAWQGLANTIAPSVPAASPAGMTAAVACGQGLYGNVARRRVVWTTVTIANLN